MDTSYNTLKARYNISETPTQLTVDIAFSEIQRDPATLRAIAINTLLELSDADVRYVEPPQEHGIVGQFVTIDVFFFNERNLQIQDSGLRANVTRNVADESQFTVGFAVDIPTDAVSYQFSIIDLPWKSRRLTLDKSKRK